MLFPVFLVSLAFVALAVTFQINDLSAGVLGNFSQFALTDALDLHGQPFTLYTDYAVTGSLVAICGLNSFSYEIFIKPSSAVYCVFTDIRLY